MENCCRNRTGASLRRREVPGTSNRAPRIGTSNRRGARHLEKAPRKSASTRRARPSEEDEHLSGTDVAHRPRRVAVAAARRAQQDRRERLDAERPQARLVRAVGLADVDSQRHEPTPDLLADGRVRPRVPVEQLAPRAPVRPRIDQKRTPRPEGLRACGGLVRSPADRVRPAVLGEEKEGNDQCSTRDHRRGPAAASFFPSGANSSSMNSFASCPVMWTQRAPPGCGSSTSA